MKRIAGDRRSQRDALQFVRGQQLRERVGANDGTGEQMASDLRRFLQYHDSPMSLRQPLQMDCASQPRRPRAHDEDIHPNL